MIYFLTFAAICFAGWCFDHKRTKKRYLNIGWNEGREYQINLTKPKRRTDGTFAPKHSDHL